MSLQIEDYLKLQQMGPAQRVTALSRIRPLVESDPTLADVVGALEEALAANRSAVEADRTYNRGLGDGQMHRDQAVALDRQLDRVLAGLYQVLEGMSVALPPESALRQEVEELRNLLFPRGLAAVVNRRYTDQHQIVNAMIEHLRTATGWIPLVDRLGLSDVLDEMVDVNALYGEALTKQSQAMAFADVQKLDRSSFREYCAVIVKVLAAYPSSSEGDTEARAALLGPVHAQQREARVYRRRRAEAAERAANGEPAASPEETPPTEDEASPGPEAQPAD